MLRSFISLLLVALLSTATGSLSAGAATGHRFTENDALNTAFLDLAIPGYGMYSESRPYWGIFYGTAKIAGAFMIYYSIKDYRYWSSVAGAAENRQAGTTAPIQFADPQGSGYLTLRELKNKRDSAYLFAVFAVVFELSVYTASFFHTYHTAYENSLHSGPVYRFSQNGADSQIKLGWAFSPSYER